MFKMDHQNKCESLVMRWVSLEPVKQSEVGQKDKNKSSMLSGFPGGSISKESTRNKGDSGSILGSGRFPWRRAWQPTPVFVPGESPWTEEPAGL